MALPSRSDKNNTYAGNIGTVSGWGMVSDGKYLQLIVIYFYFLKCLFQNQELAQFLDM